MPHINLSNGTTRPVNTIYCIGRSYVEHIHELGNSVPDEPLVFLKPNSSLCTGDTLTLPDFSNNIHYETEVVLSIGDNGTIDVAVGLDLTARDVQEICKQKGLPWLKAKGFKNACWVGTFSPLKPNHDYTILLSVNDETRQHDSTAKLMYSFAEMIRYLDTLYGVQVGDLIFTGTPKGVGKLDSGDRLITGIDDERYELKVV